MTNIFLNILQIIYFSIHENIPGLCLLFSSEANSRTNSLVDCCLMIVVADFLFPVDFWETRTVILVINSDMAQLILQSGKENQLVINKRLCSTMLHVYTQCVTLADCRLHLIHRPQQIALGLA